MSTSRVTLDNPVFTGRLRQFSRGTPFIHAPQRIKLTVIQDVVESSKVLRTTKSSPINPALPRTNRSIVLQRHLTPAPSVVNKKSKRLDSQKMLIAMACLVFVAGLSVAALGFKTNKHVEAQATAVTQEAEDSDTSEVAPNQEALRNYQVNPSLPRYIRIPSLSVFARIQRQGVDKTGALKAPGNVHDAGWYENSSKPGETGAMLLDGHVAGPTQHGVFYSIKNLKAGDEVEVERGDGQKFTYKVVKSVVTESSKTDMSQALAPVVAGKAGLNLITCTGQYDIKTKEYNQRITVFTVQI